MSIDQFLQTDINIPQETAICATDIKFANKFADLLSLRLITFLVFLCLVYVYARCLDCKDYHWLRYLN